MLLCRQDRIHSSDSVPRVNDPLLLRHNSVGLPAAPATPQQLSRQSLQALSAAPRSKIISPDTWVQAKRKPEAARNAASRDSCNYQHWLIQVNLPLNRSIFKAIFRYILSLRNQL